MESAIEKADRLGRKRARVLPVLAILLITQQTTFFTDRAAQPARMVDWVHLGAWVGLTLVILLLLTHGGGWFRSREVRALMNDEVTRENRRQALAQGFVIAMATTVVCFVVSFFEEVQVRTALHVISSTGLAGALLRFAALERRAHG